MKITRSLITVAIAILQMDQDDDGRIWGYGLSKKSGVRSGVLYPTLDRMLMDGWVEDHWESHDEAKKRPPRRYYTLTDKGRRELGAVARTQREPLLSPMTVSPA